MKKYFAFTVTAVLILSFKSCIKSGASQPSPQITLVFDSIPIVKKLSSIINETSGIADSKLNPGHLWAQEDSDSPTQLYLINHSGDVIKRVHIKNVVNRDWEDMALMGNDIYIGEIGDNNLVYPVYSFYIFSEPLLSADTIYNAVNIQFVYPDGSHDAEAFLVDPATKDIYIITKRDQPSKIYKLTYPYRIGATNTTSLVGNLDYTGVVGAAISADGKEIILKTYTSLNYYTRNTNEQISETLKKKYSKIGYVPEPQGEAIGFAINNSGFFTLSEKGFSNAISLYFYPRK
ncbi:MAG: hypothetical protein ABR503_10170 [Chitinophagaceae bacterium]